MLLISVSRDPKRQARDVLFHISHGHLLFWKPDSSLKFPIPFRLAMASAANNSINFIITGDEDPQMDGQDDPVQEQRQEGMYTHVFEGQSMSSALKVRKRGTRLRSRAEMMRTVLSNEGHLFNQDERLIFSRYRKLSCK